MAGARHHKVGAFVAVELDHLGPAGKTHLDVGGRLIAHPGIRLVLELHPALIDEDLNVPAREGLAWQVGAVVSLVDQAYPQRHDTPSLHPPPFPPPFYLILRVGSTHLPSCFSDRKSALGKW